MGVRGACGRGCGEGAVLRVGYAVEGAGVLLPSGLIRLGSQFFALRTSPISRPLPPALRLHPAEISPEVSSRPDACIRTMAGYDSPTSRPSLSHAADVASNISARRRSCAAAHAAWRSGTALRRARKLIGRPDIRPSVASLFLLLANFRFHDNGPLNMAHSAVSLLLEIHQYSPPSHLEISESN